MTKTRHWDEYRVRLEDGSILGEVLTKEEADNYDYLPGVEIVKVRVTEIVDGEEMAMVPKQLLLNCVKAHEFGEFDGMLALDKWVKENVTE